MMSGTKITIFVHIFDNAMQSGFLPPPSAIPAYLFLGEPDFRLALNFLGAMYELTASTDLPVLDGVMNDLLRDLLNSLAVDACAWVSVLSWQPLLNFNATHVHVAIPLIIISWVLRFSSLYH